MRRALVLMLLLLGCGELNNGETDGGFFGGKDASVRDAAAPNLRIRVDAVFDGDTVLLSASSAVRTPDGKPMNGEKVRMLGVDAPEIAHPDAMPPTAADCWGPEAKDAATMLMNLEYVTLEYDTSHELRDTFGRLLAYVKLSDGRVVNEVLIRQGHAKSFRAFAHRDRSKYNSLEAMAEAERLGLWGNCP